MAERFIYTMRDLRKRFGQKLVLDDISLSYYHGAKIGVVGDNGSGKSTLLRIMAGVDKEYEGLAEPAKGARIGYVSQEPRLQPGLSVRENLRLAFRDITSLLERYDKISAELESPGISDTKMQKLVDELSEAQEKIEAAGGWELDRRIEQAADALFLPDETMDIGKLSGGEARRVALCRALLERPDLLLLDEPTNHLDAETTAWLEVQLREYPGTVIIVTHDRYFLDRITRWILELDHGKGYPFEGNYSSWLEQKAQRLAQESGKAEAHRRELSRELEWIRANPGARRGRNKARLSNYESLSGAEFEVHEDSLEIQIPPGPHLGNLVVRAEGLGKSYGDKVLFKDFSLEIPPGAIIGIIGPNGVGKTTLFRMIMGQDKPDSGQLEVGPTVQLSYVDQARDTLNDDKTVFEEISGGQDFLELGGKRMASRAYVGRFNFKGPDQQKKVGKLSGGERNRVHLAKLLRRGGNVLMLDEPTNDLDTATLRHLEEALLGFPSCALIISHDRYFLDRVCTHLLAFEGGGRVAWYEGGFAEYEAKKLEAGEDIFLSRRARYRKLPAAAG